MSKSIILVENLRKVYKVGNENVVALNNLSFEVETGQILCIVGTSGSGKSTLLNQLAGLEKPTSGSVTLGKSVISQMSEDRLAKFRQKYVGFVFQSYNLLPFMTALENVSMPLVFRGMSKKSRDKTASYFLNEVGLSDRINHTPNQMSGGQQQRVGIARAFVSKPKIIFADEPTGNLDTKTTIEVMRMMVHICRENNQTLILVTHDNELAKYADRIIRIMDGKIISDRKNLSLIDSQNDGEAYKALDEKLEQIRLEENAEKNLEDYKNE